MQSVNDFPVNATENETMTKPEIWSEDFRLLRPIWDLRIG